MDAVREIAKVIKSQPTVEGAGVRLHRAIGFSEPQVYDPFLLLDDFRSNRSEHYRKGFPWHPHRGIETITYVLRGTVEHQDSMGNKGTLSPGDVQWMTAGRGIIHQEMPNGDVDGAMHGFQLWANLPAKDKMMPPRYQEIAAAKIPDVTTPEKTIVKVIAGNFGGQQGPVRDVVIDPLYVDVQMQPASAFELPVTPGHTCFAYVIGGEARFGTGEETYSYPVEGVGYFDTDLPKFIANGHLVLFGDGDLLHVKTGAAPARFLVVSGRPLKEPIAWRGPIVMNSQEELQTAFAELDNGTFLKAD